MNKIKQWYSRQDVVTQGMFLGVAIFVGCVIVLPPLMSFADWWFGVWK